MVLRVHITSGYGSWEAVLYPGQAHWFSFVKDGRPRVLSAFTLDNKLVDLIAFTPIDHIAHPNVGCFPVIQSVPTTTPAAGQERQREE
jgi:hypothetical protein